jgi:hypothetical protein
MNEQEPVDLSTLDPSWDAGGWQSRVEATLRRVDAVLAARRRRPLDLIAAWSRRLMIAAAVLVVLLVPAEAALDGHEARAEQLDLLVRLAERSAHGERPTGEELRRVIGPAGQP